MPFLVESHYAVVRNWAALALYAAVIIPLDVAMDIADHYLKQAGFDTIPLPLMAGRVVLLCLLYAAIQTIVFARIGKEIDKPLWKIEGDGEALRRFLGLWMALNVISIVTFQPSLLILHVLFAVIAIPFGACLMFQRDLRPERWGQALEPLLVQPGRALVLAGVMTLQVILNLTYLFRLATNPDSLWLLAQGPLFNAVSAYLDCLVFSGAWILCIQQRNADTDVYFDDF